MSNEPTDNQKTISNGDRLVHDHSQTKDMAVKPITRQSELYTRDLFIAERESIWSQLESIVDDAEHHGVRKLTPASQLALPHLYRATLSSLSFARDMLIDRELIEYLESLSKRAYVLVYTPPITATQLIGQFLARDFPQAVRDLAWPIALSACCVFLGMLAGWIIVDYDIMNYFSVIPESVAQDRTPYSSTEDLRSVLYPDKPSLFTLELFSMQLFTNNASVAILAFGLGMLLAIPTMIVLFYNGAMLGAMSALHAEKTLGFDFFAWLSVHGTTELTAIILAGGAGLALAKGFLFPAFRVSRIDSVREYGIKAGLVVLGAVVMLFVAALIEGFARQLIPGPVHKLTIGWGLAILWFVYFFKAGRSGGPE